MKELRKQHIFSRWMWHCYHIEYKKHGLPYSYLLLFLHEDNHFFDLTTIDNIICAKFPSDEADPELLSIITAAMVNGHVVLRTQTIRACHDEQGKRVNAINVPLRLFNMEPPCKLMVSRCTKDTRVLVMGLLYDYPQTAILRQP